MKLDMSENVIYSNQSPKSPSVPPVTPPNQPPLPPQQPATESSSKKGLLLRAGIGIVVLLLLVLLFVFVVLPKISGGNNQNKQVTLTYWGLWEDPKVMQPILDDFHKKYPNITVKYTLQDPKQYRERLLTRIKEGKGPDLYRYHSTWVSELIAREALLPLPQEVIKTDDFKKVYYPVMVSDLIKNGALYGVPLHIDTLAMFVNTEILEAQGASVPKTWDEFLKVSKQLTVPDENGNIKTAGAALGTYDNITHAQDILSLLFLQSQANMITMSKTLPQIAEVLQFYTSFNRSEQKTWDSSLEPSYLSFANGNLALFFGYSWDIFAIKAVNKDLKFTVHPVPHLPGEKDMTVASYWVEGVSAQSANQNEAFLFMKYLTDKETLKKLYTEQAKTRAFGELYPQQELADLLKTDSLVYPFVQQAPVAKSSYYVSNTRDGDSGLNTLVSNYLGATVRTLNEGKGTEETEAEKLAQKTAKEFAKYGIK
jgi:multiple sugar transport system substrate-binding protein